MSEDLLQIDDALQKVIEELKTFKSASQQLSIADQNTTQILESVDRLVGHTVDVADTGRKQVTATERLQRETEERVEQVLHNQQALAATVEQSLQAVAATQQDITQTLQSVQMRLNSELQPQLETVRRSARANRALVIIALILLAFNGVIGVLLLRATPAF